MATCAPDFDFRRCRQRHLTAGIDTNKFSSEIFTNFHQIPKIVVQRRLPATDDDEARKCGIDPAAGGALITGI